MVKNRNNKGGSAFDIVAIIQFIAMSVIFVLLTFGVNHVVKMAIHSSPTGRCTNGYLTIYEVHNTGAAFNLFAGNQEFLICVSLVALALIVGAIFIFSGRFSYSSVTHLSMLFTGILMNTIDRIKLGYVFDYIHCNFLPTFPMFNVADMMIVIGAVCLVFSLIFSRK